MDPITGFLINLIIGIVLSAASTLLKQAFAPKEQKSTGTRGSAQVGGKVPQYFLVGTVGEPGKFEDGGEWGNDGEVPNAFTTDVHSFGDLPITGLSGLFVNGVKVAIPATGAVDQGYPVADLSGKFWWKFYDGNQTTADAFLVSKFGAKADRPWTSDKIGRGLPYLVTTSLWDETLWTAFPKIMGEFQGIKLYDPRLDTTAGGSGSQRWDNPSTWAFSDNNAVIIYNIERGIYYDGAKVWGGSATEAQLPYDVWAAAMDACDEPVTLEAGGTEKRFRAGRRINLNERPADVIKELLIGANARISHASDGTIYVLVGVPDEPDGAFSDADVLASEPLGSIPFPNLDSIINGATATYREPLQAWEDKETAPYYRSDLETEDDGRRQVEGLDLGTTFSGTQAQRIIKAVVEEGRRFKTHVVALPPEYAQFRPLQVLAWTSERFDYSAKLFLITARTRTPWGQVVFGLQEIDPADHDWTPGTDEQPLSFAPVVTNRPAPQEVSGPSVAPVPGELAYDVFWSAPSVAVDVDFVRISHRVPPETDSQYTVVVPKPDLLTGSARIPVPLSLSGETIEVQIEYIALSGREMVASAWMEVTIGVVGIGPGDLTDEVNNSRAWASRTIEQIMADSDAMLALLGDAMMGNAVDRQTLRTEITARFETTTAAYVLAIEVVATDLGALAQVTETLSAEYQTSKATFEGQITTLSTGQGALVTRTENLEATVNDPTTGVDATAAALSSLSSTVTTQGSAITANAAAVIAVEADVDGRFAGGLFTIEAVSAPGGWDARAALAVRATTGVSFTIAGIYLDAKSDGTSRIVLDADELVTVGKQRSVSGLSFIDWDTGAMRLAG
ncbi:phage tail protein [Devosia sp. Root635]|uniref:phage tail protein n=1 Tax=Devosia sp. Root635 TaxID=1736575 RepID=UPI0006FB8476|nr:phage tail protein [Devosia sp. Root635]KRA42088.1 hypothetical protein ASD80_10195 [Devosia sp. Root635]